MSSMIWKKQTFIWNIVNLFNDKVFQINKLCADFLNMLKLFIILATFGVVLAQEDVWWHHASIYQIYPRSFKDSDGDGIGDLKGRKIK